MTENQRIANKVANIAFAGKVLMLRISVYKKRARKMQKIMLEAYNKGEKNEAYPYAMGILMIKNHIKVLVDTAKKINFFVDYTISQLADKPPANLVDLLTKFDDSVKKRGVLAYRRHLEKFETSFDLGLDEDSKYPELNLTRETKKKALAELRSAVKKSWAKANKKEELINPTQTRNQSQSTAIIQQQ